MKFKPFYCLSVCPGADGVLSPATLWKIRKIRIYLQLPWFDLDSSVIILCKQSPQRWGAIFTLRSWFHSQPSREGVGPESSSTKSCSHQKHFSSVPSPPSTSLCHHGNSLGSNWPFCWILSGCQLRRWILQWTFFTSISSEHKLDGNDLVAAALIFFIWQNDLDVKG